MVSILIFSIGVIALIGTQSVMVGNSIDAENRIQAAYLANQLVGQMWVDRGVDDANLNTYDTADGGTRPPGHFLDTWLAQVAASLPGASGANAPTVRVNTGTGQVDITIRWQRPSEGQMNTYGTSAVITGSQIH
jgi:type IV pilus assembly protein PilV